MAETRCDELFEALVDSIGVKAFAANIGLSARQVHRMLSGTQPNPVTRLCEALAAGDGFAATATLDYLCQRWGGHFVEYADNLAVANVNAVKEAAEAIIAITEGRSVRMTVKEIREAISALAALEGYLRAQDQTEE